MKLNKEDLLVLSKVAVKAAREAGDLIGKYVNESVLTEKKDSGTSPSSQVVTEVDKLSQEIILKAIKPTQKQYNLGLLTEELPDDGSRFKKDYFWCIDPLDGTLSFVESRPGYAVSIALVSRDGEPLIGVVYDPLAKKLYHAIKGGGAFRNEKPWIFKKKSGKSITIINYGGAVMNACQVLERGRSLFYKKPKPEQGGGCLWDYAATACLYEELGAWVSDASGNPLNLNSKESLYMNGKGVLFASSEEIAKKVLEQ